MSKLGGPVMKLCECERAMLLPKGCGMCGAPQCCPVCCRDAKLEVMVVDLAAAQSGWELAVAAGQEWKKKFDQAEAERIHYKEESERQEKRAEEIFTELNVVKNSLPKEKLERAEQDVRLHRVAAQNVALRRALHGFMNPPVGDACDPDLMVEVNKSWDAGGKAIALTPTQAEKEVVETNEIILRSREAVNLCGLENSLEYLEKALRDYDAVRKEQPDG